MGEGEEKGVNGIRSRAKCYFCKDSSESRFKIGSGYDWTDYICCDPCYFLIEALYEGIYPYTQEDDGPG